MPRPRPQPIRGITTALLAFAISCAAIAATKPKMPGPSPQIASRDPVKENARCETCHVDEAREHQASLHARATTDPAYRRALAREPLSFCRGCHSPEEAAEVTVVTARAALGVACVTCHLTGATEDGVLAAPLAPGRTAREAPHRVLRDERFAGDGACGRCHEFAFPDGARRAQPLSMQSTMSEHAASPDREVSCASCHMPGEARRSHRFPGGHDAALVRSAVDVTIERVSAVVVRVTLSPRHVGHSFPTGDLFRRVEVLAEAVGPDSSVAASRSRHLARHFQDVSTVRMLASDDRVSTSPSVVELSLDDRAADLPISVVVSYQRVEHPRDDADEAPMDGEIELSRTLLSPHRGTHR